MLLLFPSAFDNARTLHRRMRLGVIDDAELRDDEAPPRARIGTTDPAHSDSLLRDRVAQLSPGQVECLRLVHQHFSSKEIAEVLGVSRHTVDQRIRRALHILGVSHRREAARINAQNLERPTADQLSPDPWSSLQPDRLEWPDVSPGLRSERFWLNLPVATKRHPQNDMTPGQRLLWIALIAMGAAFSAGMYLAGLESFARLIR